MSVSSWSADIGAGRTSPSHLTPPRGKDDAQSCSVDGLAPMYANLAAQALHGHLSLAIA